MRFLLATTLLLAIASLSGAQTKTWDGRYATDDIELTVVYFVPADRSPLPDWRERVDYYCRRIELFHVREFQGQSRLTTLVHPEPLLSESTTEQLRRGDQNAIYRRTLGETDRRIDFASSSRPAFQILLVLSDINWRPLDDFFRLRPQNGGLAFEGYINRQGHHFPFAKSGGSRASYRPNRGVGWGLVSADGWRVPYRGSDCVIYHEGCGHTVGLPHPEESDGSVMSQAQFLGWLSESWLDKDQKARLGWTPQGLDTTDEIGLFSRFRAIPEPAVPQPNQEVRLALDWPEDAHVKSLRVRLQTSIDSPWIEIPQSWEGAAPAFAKLPVFDRATPISYRVDAQLENGAKTELWGYFQVRRRPRENPQPLALSQDRSLSDSARFEEAVVGQLPAGDVDILALVDVDDSWMMGQWKAESGKLLSPKQFGARIELPYTPPAEYRLTLIVEPLDPPNGLLLGQRIGDRRFVVLVNYASNQVERSALENIDGHNVGNESTFSGTCFRQHRLSQVVVTVRKQRVTVSVDGSTIVDWAGASSRLSLSDYWRTPNEAALFLGAYDCRYRFHRVTLDPIEGTGKLLKQNKRSAQ